MLIEESVQNKVIRWARDKGIVLNYNSERLAASQRLKQFGKMREEVEELGEELESGDVDKARMELGDVLITCVIQAELLGTDITECMQMAYDKIAKRKGTTVDGVFIKEG